MANLTKFTYCTLIRLNKDTSTEPFIIFEIERCGFKPTLEKVLFEK